MKVMNTRKFLKLLNIMFQVQRFLEQVTGDNVALTGLRFFNVTRGLLLSVRFLNKLYHYCLFLLLRLDYILSFCFEVRCLLKYLKVRIKFYGSFALSFFKQIPKLLSERLILPLNRKNKSTPELLLFCRKHHRAGDVVMDPKID